MTKAFFPHRPEETEDTITYHLAELLRRKGIDATPQFKVGGGRHHDIHILIDNLAVAVEAKKGQSNTAFKNAIKSADGRIDDNTADAAIALCYPNGCNSANVDNSTFMWAVRTPRTMTAAARPDFGGIDDLVGELRNIGDYVGDPERLAARLSDAVNTAASRLSTGMRQSLADSVNLRPNKGSYHNAAKRALLVVANAVMFHSRLEENFLSWNKAGKFGDGDKPMTARQCLNAPSVCGAYDKAWESILHINYRPIFEVARSVVAFNGAESAVKAVAEVALEIAKDYSSLRRDFMGGLFHRSLENAECDGSYYTTPASAVLLAGLAVENAGDDYRIIDPACGTGTLLMAAAEAVRDERGIGNANKELNRHIVEDVIHGIDVNATATQMASTSVGLISTRTDFAKINIRQAEYGVVDGVARLGALEYLAGHLPNQVRPLVSMEGEGTNPVKGGKEQMPDYAGKFDLVLMNPPFGAAQKRYKDMPPDDIEAMKAREQLLFADTAVHQSSNANNFITLADKLLRKDGGKMAAILPLVTSTAATALEVRKFIAEGYHIETIVVSHDPKRFWLSGKTAISEMMIIARRRIKGDKPKSVRVVALRYNPETPSAARLMARRIMNGNPSPYFEVHKISPKQLTAGDWSGIHFLSPYLSAAFYKLRGGDYFTAMPLETKASIASPEPRYSTFVKSSGGEYSALWNNDTAKITTMATTPDCRLSPRKGKERQAAEMVDECGRIKIPYKLNLPTARICASFVVRKSLGGWFSSVKIAEWQEKALCLFINSSFGILGLLGVKNAFKLPRPDFDKPYIAKLPVPVLKKAQAAQMGKAFDKLSKETLLPLPQMADDEVRIKIDHAVADALKVDREIIDRLRDLLATEPCISGKRSEV